jgi:hypothetical protein
MRRSLSLGRTVARALSSSFRLTIGSDERIPLLQNTARYRNEGAPCVGFTRGGVLIMPKGLKRSYGRGDLFLTFSCYPRLPLLKTMRARNLFVHALGRIRERYKFLLVGYAV